VRRHGPLLARFLGNCSWLDCWLLDLSAAPYGGSDPAVMVGCSGMAEQGAPAALRVLLGSEWWMNLRGELLPDARLFRF